MYEETVPNTSGNASRETCHSTGVTSHALARKGPKPRGAIVEGPELANLRFRRVSTLLEIEPEDENNGGARHRSAAAERQAKKRESDLANGVVSMSTKAPSLPGIARLAKDLPMSVSDATLEALSERTLQEASAALGQSTDTPDAMARTPKGVQAVDQAAKTFVAGLIRDLEPVIRLLAAQPEQASALSWLIDFPGGPLAVLAKAQKPAEPALKQVRPEPVPTGQPQTSLTPHVLSPDLVAIVERLGGDADGIRAIQRLLATEDWKERLAEAQVPMTTPAQTSVPEKLVAVVQRISSASRPARQMIKLVLELDPGEQPGGGPDARWLALKRLLEGLPSEEVMRLAAGLSVDPKQLLATPELQRSLGRSADVLSRSIESLIKHVQLRDLLSTVSGRPLLAGHLGTLVSSLRKERIDRPEEFTKLQYRDDEPAPNWLVRLISKVFSR